MFIAVLFTIAKVWKQPRCPSNRWMDKKHVQRVGHNQMAEHVHTHTHILYNGMFVVAV